MDEYKLLKDTFTAEDFDAENLVLTAKEAGCKYITLMDILAAPEGIAVIRRDHPDIDVFVAAVDEKLNDHAYIVPGLGDAGERIFGTK